MNKIYFFLIVILLFSCKKDSLSGTYVIEGLVLGGKNVDLSAFRHLNYAKIEESKIIKLPGLNERIFCTDCGIKRTGNDDVEISCNKECWLNGMYQTEFFKDENGKVNLMFFNNRDTLRLAK